MKRETRDAGLFVSHQTSPRIERHFARLRREGGASIDWHVLQAGKTEGTVNGLSSVAASRWMPIRASQMEANGGFLGGFLDALVIPFVLATRASFVWIVEYDVDFSGHWDEFFTPFQDQDIDVLTTTVYPRSESPDWAHWETASAPSSIQATAYHRSFAPVMRLSRRFALEYIRSMSVPGWTGHYEFTIPTVALSAGCAVEDLGGFGPLCPDHRRGRNYSNTHTNFQLIPGTFVWRPSLSNYFHERPNIFSSSNTLFHPVKPAMRDWDNDL